MDWIILEQQYQSTVNEETDCKRSEGIKLAGRSDLAITKRYPSLSH
ncbi:hypothetical protein [Klebsiella phage 05F01]|nr:hypothetical protein [Klebsiella phage 05F01]